MLVTQPLDVIVRADPAQVVINGDLFTASEQAVYIIRADKPRPTSYQVALSHQVIPARPRTER